MILALEESLHARLAAVLPPDMEILGTGQHVDMSEEQPPVALKVSFERLTAGGQVQTSARQFAEFSIAVYVDIDRADAVNRALADSLFVLAMQQLLGWSPFPGRECRLIDGPPAHDESGVIPIGFALTVPVFLTAT